jgi:hypothetical protein
MAAAPEDQLQNNFQIVRPPEAQSLPLNSRNVGMFRWQLSDKTTLILNGRGERCDVGFWHFASFWALGLNGRFRGKADKFGRRP